MCFSKESCRYLLSKKPRDRLLQDTIPLNELAARLLEAGMSAESFKEALQDIVGLDINVDNAAFLALLSRASQKDIKVEAYHREIAEYRHRRGI